MLCFYHNDNAPRLEYVHERIGDLARHPLLDLGAPGVHVHQPGQLRQTRNLSFFVGYVPDVGQAEERRQMMLAGAVQLDVAHQDHLVVIGVEDRGEHVLRLLPQAAELLSVGPGHAGRGVPQAVTFRVLADGQQDLMHRSLDAGSVKLRVISHA